MNPKEEHMRNIALADAAAYAPAAVALEDMSAKDLKAKAKELGLTGYSSLSKDDLIAAIEGG